MDPVTPVRILATQFPYKRMNAITPPTVGKGTGGVVSRLGRLAGPAMLLVLALSCGDSRKSAGESGPSWSPDSSKFAFALDGDIYVKDNSGGERTNLTKSTDDDSDPAWSPAGDVIAFIARGQLGSDVYVVRPDGTGLTNLTHLPAVYFGMSWSPDGAKIAFASDRSERGLPGRSQALESNIAEGRLVPPPTIPPELWVMNAEGADKTRLTFNQAFDGNPTWSSDGTRLAFQSDRDGDHEIYVMNVDGTGLAQLTDNDGVDAFPAWSPDGRQIAFSSNRARTEFASDLALDYDIYVMDPDGNAQVDLNDVAQLNFTRPTWSPDSRYIAFDGRDTLITGTSARGPRGINEIYLTDLETPDSSFFPVTTNRTSDPDLFLGPAVWSPDGRYLAFLSRQTGTSRVVVVEVGVLQIAPDST